MKSYGISVTEFSSQDLSDIKELKGQDSKHFKKEVVITAIKNESLNLVCRKMRPEKHLNNLMT